jgi:hypothetical protein
MKQVALAYRFDEGTRWNDSMSGFTVEKFSETERFPSFPYFASSTFFHTSSTILSE